MIAHAFVGESEQTGVYLPRWCWWLVPHRLAGARQAMRELLLPGQK